MKLNLNKQSAGIFQHFKLILLVLIAFFTCSQMYAKSSQTPIQVDNNNLLVSVDAVNAAGFKGKRNRDAVQ